MKNWVYYNLTLSVCTGILKTIREAVEIQNKGYVEAPAFPIWSLIPHK